MNTKMFHRGPMDRLTTFTHLPVLSTCLLLLIQFQIFHALPTSAASSLSTSSSNQNQDQVGNTQGASSSSTSDDSVYPYSSYRPGLIIDSYRPYAYYQQQQEIQQIQQQHPNSVYSSQSATPPSQSKVGQLIAKESHVETSKQYIDNFDRVDKGVTIVDNEKKIPFPEEGRQPRLSPLPSRHFEEKKVIDPENEEKKSQEILAQEQKSIVELSYPPPFAPELDPRYERRESGLGPISLLDQAGPFW
ncbi:unnamed protein product [Orchesella dallaii]|uniref:Uncharacterized protein n=1 Tax=Orchesella dallaii TaxID=48710 RepID=A0ABP1QKT8_9HEXA